MWQRFRESPAEYVDIPNRLREAQPEQLLLPNPGSWPGPSEDAEEAVRSALIGSEYLSPHEARQLNLEEDHKVRRGYVWADLG